MPLRDHFRPPLSQRRSWDGVYGGWPAMIVMDLFERLPHRYIAEPRVHLNAFGEIDAVTYEESDADNRPIATRRWSPPAPTSAIAVDPPNLDEYEVRFYDTHHGRRLVAAVEIVSPANKDRPEHRRAFVAKCASLLQDGVCVAIVDLVTTRSGNLYADLMEFLGQADPALAQTAPHLYAVGCRWAKQENVWLLQTWAHPLAIGQALPTLPLWLAEDLAIPLELERSYEETCRVLRIA